MDDDLNIYLKIPQSKMLGPDDSLRYILGLQGCDKNCQGCMSQLSRRKDLKNYQSVISLAKEILAVKDIEGITITGGEAFLQISALLELLKIIKEKSNLGVIVYTGYTLEQVEEMKEGKEILKYIDLLIDGPYIEALNDNSTLRGSSNQRVILLTERYQSSVEAYQKHERKCEVVIKNDCISMIGIPSKQTYHVYLEMINRFKEVKKDEVLS